MSPKTATPTIWHMPDDLWKHLAPVLGPEKAPGTPGRPATPFRLLFDALVYVLRTGCQWHAVPRQDYAPGSTVHGWFRRWVKAGVFEKAWKLLLEYYDEEVGIDWKWQAMDGVITKAPLGGEATGPSPVDRAKAGTKRSVLSDGRGAPLAVLAAGANVPDQTLALETVDSTAGMRPEKGVYRVHHLSLDAGYNYADVLAGLRERAYLLHLRPPAKAKIAVAPEKRYQ